MELFGFKHRQHCGWRYSNRLCARHGHDHRSIRNTAGKRNTDGERGSRQPGCYRNIPSSDIYGGQYQPAVYGDGILQRRQYCRSHQSGRLVFCFDCDCDHSFERAGYGGGYRRNQHLCKFRRCFTNDRADRNRAEHHLYCGYARRIDPGYRDQPAVRRDRDL